MEQKYQKCLTLYAFSIWDSFPVQSSLFCCNFLQISSFWILITAFFKLSVASELGCCLSYKIKIKKYEKTLWPFFPQMCPLMRAWLYYEMWWHSPGILFHPIQQSAKSLIKSVMSGLSYGAASCSIYSSVPQRDVLQVSDWTEVAVGGKWVEGLSRTWQTLSESPVPIMLRVHHNIKYQPLSTRDVNKICKLKQ